VIQTVPNVNKNLQNAFYVHLVQVETLYIFSMILNAMQHVHLDIMDKIIHVCNVILHVVAVQI
jgi:hypothetical protein